MSSLDYSALHRIADLDGSSYAKIPTTQRIVAGKFDVLESEEYIADEAFDYLKSLKEAGLIINHHLRRDESIRWGDCWFLTEKGRKCLNTNWFSTEKGKKYYESIEYNKDVQSLVSNWSRTGILRGVTGLNAKGLVLLMEGQRKFNEAADDSISAQSRRMSIPILNMVFRRIAEGKLVGSLNPLPSWFEFRKEYIHDGLQSDVLEKERYLCDKISEDIIKKLNETNDPFIIHAIVIENEGSTDLARAKIRVNYDLL